jgi:S-adenosylmethionine:tRNA ribosyltransferase-isomerase
MQVSDFQYDLPESLIAQEPAKTREDSRLLVIDRASASLTDSEFSSLPEHLRSGDLLVLNNTRVFPARLIGRRLRTSARGETVLGGRVEVFLVSRREPLIWEALVKPGRALLPGARVEFQRGKLNAEVLEWREGGRRIVRFEVEGDFDEIVDRIGRTPLPPYIKRDEEDRLDAERYQTVFARERGAVAAPTAGLHFTNHLLDRIRERGVEIAEMTLHVGYGTFQPVRVARVEDHRVESEMYSIPESTASAINRALIEGRRIVAVGTTTTRGLESAFGTGSASGSGRLIAAPQLESTELFIYPGYEFKVVGGLVTNFHLPCSSLLMLVAAFGGYELVMKSYRHAVEQKYRFYSYGDAMLVL